MHILIDGNAMGHAYHNMTTLTVGNFQTQAIFGFTKMIGKIAADHKDDEILVLWDGRAQFRYDLLPEYKANRDTKDDPKREAHRQAYRKQVPLIRATLKTLGVKQAICPTHEADDLAGYLAPRIAQKDKVLLITGDRDWLQLVSDNIEWFDPREEGKRVNMANFTDETGYFTPREFLQGKALMGDTSDNIPGVGGLGQKYASELLAEFGSVEAFLEKCDNGSFKPKYKRHKDLAFGPGREIYKRNMKLMDMTLAPKPEGTIYEPGQFNEEEFRKICDRLAFFSIKREWSTFLAPFAYRAEKRMKVAV